MYVQLNLIWNQKYQEYDHLFIVAENIDLDANKIGIEITSYSVIKRTDL